MKLQRSPCSAARPCSAAVRSRARGAAHCAAAGGAVVCEAPLAHQGSTLELTQWWNRLGDPVLSDWIARAQTQSPTVASALAQVSAARAAVAASEVQAGPQVAAVAGQRLPRPHGRRQSRGQCARCRFAGLVGDRSVGRRSRRDRRRPRPRGHGRCRPARSPRGGGRRACAAVCGAPPACGPAGRGQQRPRFARLGDRPQQSAVRPEKRG
ncbi:MAG: hypothetical protein MZW92_33775 [Comamonadaceae bacterium]|nr:hypothetical protein [Comamonadaceae bacterium]